MQLILIITLICLLLNLAHDIIKKLRIGKWFVGKSKAENAELEQQLAAAKENLEKVKNGPSSGEYALFVKTMRAEQKIKDIEEKMVGDKNMDRLKTISIELVGGYVLKVILLLVLLGFSIWYRYTPILLYDDRFYFSPFGLLLSFPTDVPNSISVPVWVLVCNFSFGKLIAFIKRRKV